MKKKIMSVVLVLAMMISLVGCTPNWTSFAKENQKVAAWAGTEFSGKGNVAVKAKVPDKNAKEENFEIPFTLNGKSKGQDLAEVNMEMSLKGLAEMAKKEGTEIPEKVNMKIYATSQRAYIEKKLFTDLLGKNAPESLKDIKEDYISIPVNSTDELMGLSANSDKMKDLTKYLTSKEFEADILTLVEKTLKGFEPSKDIKVSGNTYTYETDIDSIVNDLNKAVETGVKNWSDVEPALINVIKKTGEDVKKEDLDKVVKSYDKAKFEEQTAALKEMLKGSDIKLSTTFNKDQYTQDVKLNLNVLEFVNVKLNMSMDSKKNDKVEIKLPTSVKNLTMMEYMNLFIPAGAKVNGPFISVIVNGEEVDFQDVEPVIEQGRTLVPVRALMEKLGAKVQWNEKTKEVTVKKDNLDILLKIGSKKAVVNGKEVTLDVPAKIENGRTLIPLRFVSEHLGYKVNFDNSNKYIYIIDVYNVTDEKLQEIKKAKEIEMQKQFKELASGNKAQAENVIGGTDGETSIKVK